MSRCVAIVIDLAQPYPWHYETFSGVADHARKRGWRVDAMAFGAQLIAASRGGIRHDGIVGRIDGKLAAFARQAGVPIVNVWHSSPVRDVPLVGPDIGACAALAADHLIGRGLRRFASAGDEGDRVSHDMIGAFRRALADAGHACEEPLFLDPEPSQSVSSYMRFQKSLTAWLGRLGRPAGLFVSDDIYAREIVNIALMNGIRVPDDLAVVGFNDIEVCSLSREPTLTSIDPGYHRIGRTAAGVLESLMDGKPPPEGRVAVRPLGLVARASTDVFASDDQLVSRAVRFMAENCHKPINAADVAAHLRVTGRTLMRHFKAAMGCRVTDELVRMRITRAKRLLVEADLPIGEVAKRCGFGGRGPFIAAFRRVENTTPQAFRGAP
jgi:LacI family transcriptional regulator